MIVTTFLISAIYAILVLFAGYYCNLFPVTYYKKNSYFIHTEKHIFLMELFILAISSYLFLCLSILTVHGDSYAFANIIRALVEEPFCNFYANGGINYPPLFNYIYYVVGKIMQLLGVPFSFRSHAFIFGMKVPPIICEFLMAWMLYRQCRRHLRREQTIPVLMLILLNPGYLLVTAYISQVDAIYVFFMLLTLILIQGKKLKLSYFAFAAAIMTKFQAIFITPVIAFAIVQQVFLVDFNWKKFWKHLGSGLCAIACMALSYVPFLYHANDPAGAEVGLTDNFTTSIQSFGYASHNTYNFWCLMGYNYRKETELFGPLSCYHWGILFIILLVLLTIVLFIRRKKDTDALPLLAAFLIAGMYCFSIRMMNRYLYPAIVLLILAMILRPTVQRFICTIYFAIIFFKENMFTYQIYPYERYTSELFLPKLISVAMLLGFGFLLYIILSEGSRDIPKESQTQ